MLAAVPDPSRDELIGLGVKYLFFVADTPERLREYCRALEFALSHTNSEVERLGEKLTKELLGESYTWKSAQDAFWSVLSAEDVFGPGADNAMGGRQE